MDGTLGVEVVETQKKLATEYGDVGLRERTGLEQIKTGPACEVFHDDPELVGDDEGAVVARHILRVALGKTGNLLLYFRDVIVRVLEVYSWA